MPSPDIAHQPSPSSDFYLGRVLLGTEGAVKDLVGALPDEEVFTHGNHFVIPHIRRHSRTGSTRATLEAQLRDMRSSHPPAGNPRRISTSGILDYELSNTRVVALSLSSRGRFGAAFLQHETVAARLATTGHEYLAMRGGEYIVRIAEVGSEAQATVAKQVLEDHGLSTGEIFLTPSIVCEAPVSTRP